MNRRLAAHEAGFLGDRPFIFKLGRSSIPENLAGQRQMMIDLIQYGGIRLETRLDQARFVSNLKTGWGDSQVADLTASIHLAEQENNLIMRGICPEVHVEHNHDIHIPVHNSQIFDSPQFLLLQNKNDQRAVLIRQAAEQHNAIHRQYQAELKPMPIETQMPMGTDRLLAGGQNV